MVSRSLDFNHERNENKTVNINSQILILLYGTAERLELWYKTSINFHLQDTVFFCKEWGWLMEKQIYDAKKTNDAIVSPIKYITTPTHVPNPPAKIYKNAQVSQLNT